VAENEYDFSFSGLKSAVLNYINGAKMKGEEIPVADLAASFQKAVTDVLVDHAMHAAKEFGFKKMAIAGGVASNTALRKAMEEACSRRGIRFYRPSPILCTDNAAMIAKVAEHLFDMKVFAELDLGVDPNWSIEKWAEFQN
jgi:N6-L-threonylcarbamoyladenine synthase